MTEKNKAEDDNSTIMDLDLQITWKHPVLLIFREGIWWFVHTGGYQQLCQAWSSGASRDLEIQCQQHAAGLHPYVLQLQMIHRF